MGNEVRQKKQLSAKKGSILSYFSNTARFATGDGIWSQIRGMRNDTKPSWVRFYQVRNCKKLLLTHALVPVAKGWKQPQAYDRKKAKTKHGQHSTVILRYQKGEFHWRFRVDEEPNQTEHENTPSHSATWINQHVPGTLAEVLTGDHFLLGRKSVKFSFKFRPVGQRVSAGVSKLHSACPAEQLGKKRIFNIFFIFWHWAEFFWQNCISCVQRNLLMEFVSTKARICHQFWILSKKLLAFRWVFSSTVVENAFYAS